MSNEDMAAPSLPLRCANQISNKPCDLEGFFTCKNCKLVSYCGPSCQKLHWSAHRAKCRSPLNKAKWTPKWDRDNRRPAWAIGEATKNLHNPYGSTKYLWGNTPAIDVAKISENEGEECDSDIALLFAASGDLRNVVKTVQDIPESFGHKIDMTVNDWEFDVVARNAIFLLFAFASLDDMSLEDDSHAHTAESLMHIWYSAFIPYRLLSSLQNKVGELLRNERTHTTEALGDGIVRKVWSFYKGGSLCITLHQEQWPKIEAFLDVPTGLTKKSAQGIRKAVVLSPERTDYRDRWYFKDAYPAMRLAKQQFREDGLLLPFGHPRTDFDTPNPTMFQSPHDWPFDDKSDPLAGWNIIEVHKTPWTASQDIYGKLFAYVRFRLFNVDVKLLPQLLTPQTYARIEVSNISDAGYVGTRQTLSLLGPLLQTKTQNPYATIITSYINAVMEVVKMTEADSMPDIDFLARYLPEGIDLVKIIRQGADFYKAWDCRTLALDGDYYFDLYMKIQGFEDAARDAGMIMKEKNTIVGAWPLRIKVHPKDRDAQEEFNLLLSSNSSGVERYVEWTRI